MIDGQFGPGRTHERECKGGFASTRPGLCSLERAGAGRELGATMPHEEEKPKSSPAPAGAEPNHIARLAHELKTPLSAIAAAAEIMRDERLGPIGSERYRGYASDIYESARHALGVIGHMLEAARSDGTPAQLSFAEVDLDDLIRGVVSAMTPLAGEARLGLAAEVGTRLPHVVADPTSVRQMLLNLITNAIKFTAPGGEIRVTASYEGDGPVTLEVRDNGPGIEATAESAAGKGLGLGLPLVKALAAANGADLVIKSLAGQGTAVRIGFRKDRVVPV